MNIEKNSIDDFLQSACRFVSTEERAQDIKDELRDHIDSYINEYMNDGLSIDEATTKALKQMGDPNTLSDEFRDKISSKTRLIIVGLISVLIFVIVSIDVFSYINGESTLVDMGIDVIFIGCNIFLLNGLMRTYKTSNILYKEEPIMYVQSYKQLNWYEKINKYISWFIILNIFSHLLPDSLSISNIFKYELSFEDIKFISLLSSELILLITYTFPNPTNPQAIVYNEGILTFDGFIPWDNILGYRWVTQQSKGKVMYFIELKPKGRYSSKYPLCSRVIKVSSEQINLVDEVFKMKDIEKRHCF